MDQAILELQENKDSTDIDFIISILNKIISEFSSLDNEILASYSIDFLIKDLLKTNKCVELVEKIPDLLPIIKDPRNFHDELVSLFDSKPLILPVLMLMYQLHQDFDFEYKNFFIQLEEILTIDNVRSEGFLFFLLRCLEDKNVDFEVIRMFLERLSSLAVFVSSSSCVKVIYCILVIMRMHPAAFKISKDLKELYILAYSFESIQNIVKRIFLEARNPKHRPKIIFLESFTFPALGK